ncbi:MAG: hypothetical protein QM710_11565 [Flavobacterium sp.]
MSKYTFFINKAYFLILMLFCLCSVFAQNSRPKASGNDISLKETTDVPVSDAEAMIDEKLKELSENICH